MTNRHIDKPRDIDHLVKALRHLDNIATSPAVMGGNDIESLCEAREHIARVLGFDYDESTNRYMEAQ